MNKALRVSLGIISNHTLFQANYKSKVSMHFLASLHIGVSIKRSLAAKQFPARVQDQGEGNNDPQTVQEHKVKPEIDGVQVLPMYEALKDFSEEVEGVPIHLTQ